jgi:hypothetical protein
MKLIYAIALALLLAPPLGAAGQEACVRCDNPFAIYRCQVDQPGLSPNASISLICITELAKRNGHATCAVSRDTGAACGGDIVKVTPSPGATVPQAPPPDLAAAPPDQKADPDNLPPPEAERTEPPVDPVSDPGDKTPKTVEELAKKTAEASQKGLKNAGNAVVDAAKKTGETIEKTGDAVGSVAKKTWRCISSMFGDC